MEASAMTRFLNLVASRTRHCARAGDDRLAQDGRCLKLACACVQGKCVVNSISLKEGR
jgi:cobalamin-dependent methionine synthase I